MVKELCTRMIKYGFEVTCYNRSGHHVSGSEYDGKIEIEGICQKFVPTIEQKGPAFFAWLPKMFGKRVVVTIHGIDWKRKKWKSGFGLKFVRQGEKNAVKYADEIIVLSEGVQNYFKDIYGRETHFIPNGVNKSEIRNVNLITEKFGLEKDSYILFLGRLVPEKGIRYLIEAFKDVKTEKNWLSLVDGKIKVVFDIPESNTFGYASDTKMKLNSDKLQGLGWKPEINLEESYRRMIRDMKDVQ